MSYWFHHNIKRYIEGISSLVWTERLISDSWRISFLSLDAFCHITQPYDRLGSSKIVLHLLKQEDIAVWHMSRLLPLWGWLGQRIRNKLLTGHMWNFSTLRSPGRRGALWLRQVKPGRTCRSLSVDDGVFGLCVTCTGFFCTPTQEFEFVNVSVVDRRLRSRTSPLPLRRRCCREHSVSVSVEAAEATAKGCTLTRCGPSFGVSRAKEPNNNNKQLKKDVKRRRVSWLNHSWFSLVPGPCQPEGREETKTFLSVARERNGRQRRMWLLCVSSRRPGIQVSRVCTHVLECS